MQSQAMTFTFNKRSGFHVIYGERDYVFEDYVSAKDFNEIFLEAVTPPTMQ